MALDFHLDVENSSFTVMETCCVFLNMTEFIVEYCVLLGAVSSSSTRDEDSLVSTEEYPGPSSTIMGERVVMPFQSL